MRIIVIITTILFITISTIESVTHIVVVHPAGRRHTVARVKDKFIQVDEIGGLRIIIIDVFLILVIHGVGVDVNAGDIDAGRGGHISMHLSRVIRRHSPWRSRG